jgi:hypothetical protein
MGKGAVQTRGRAAADSRVADAVAVGYFTLRTGVADSVEDLRDRDGGGFRRDPGRRLFAGDGEGALARMRVGAIPHPTMILAFADGPGVLQHRDGPSAQCPDRRQPFLRHQHRDRSCLDESIRPPGGSGRLAQSRAGIRFCKGCGLSTCSACLCKTLGDRRGSRRGHRGGGSADRIRTRLAESALRGLRCPGHAGGPRVRRCRLSVRAGCDQSRKASGEAEMTWNAHGSRWFFAHDRLALPAPRGFVPDRLGIP